MYKETEFNSRTGQDYERVIKFEKTEDGSVTIQTKHGHGRGCATKWVVLNRDEISRLIEFINENS